MNVLCDKVKVVTAVSLSFTKHFWSWGRPKPSLKKKSMNIKITMIKPEKYSKWMLTAALHQYCVTKKWTKIN